MSRSMPGKPWIAVLVAAALTLAACSGGDDPDENQQTPDGKQNSAAPTPTTAPISISYASSREFSSYNNNIAEQANPANAVVLNHVLRGFWYFGPDGERVPDPDFGSFKQLSSNPQTVEYTFAEGATWSDGEPLDCDDAVLAWAANVGRWPTGERDQYTGDKLTAFSAINPAAWADVSMPKCADGERSFTVTFDRVFADWTSLFGPGTILPAHVVEKRSGVKDLIAAVEDGKQATMEKIGKTYNTIWVFKPGSYDQDIAPSAGPYQVASWKAGEALTLEPNPKWWGTPPAVQNVVIRMIPEDEQAQALIDGTVQVIDPTPTEAMLKTLAAAGDAVQVSSHDSFVWEHLDFNFDGQFKSRALRQAFAKCVPRQQILDELIKPANPQAQVLQSRFRLPFQEGYEQTSATGGQAYAAVDLEGSRKILKDLKKTGTKVRIAYLAPDLRREQEVKLIKKSCEKAGFKIEDAGSYTFFSSELERGDFDAALYAWTSSAMLSQTYPIYVSKGTQNFIGYSDKNVDLLLKRLYSELDPERQLSLLEQLDTALWEDVATLPLFVFPGLVASAPQVEKVQYNPSWSGPTWNANVWTETAQP
ncbi:ABC transporter family substrate-binding protein [Kineosporia babensis]|uniref:ABC transporter family substrate-binding protein n=1 Tax=Kineosporia babensis TaxID=499548 RepID=A0A9X1NHS5_9ACTN|nr:ABC transporter family substrate-binding protein [Kineosporia babensis]MCD5315247.1 ABC transporter family substrate-binding protein [Kineosporia babensis]